jgi:hypothetical protein
MGNSDRSSRAENDNVIRIEYPLEIDTNNITPNTLTSIKNEIVRKIIGETAEEREKMKVFGLDPNLAFIKFIKKKESVEIDLFGS